jgi:hypothetical protein
VNLLDNVLPEWGHVIKLGITGIGVQEIFRLLRLKLEERVSTALQNLLVYSQKQRCTRNTTSDANQLFWLHSHGIIDQNPGHGLNSWICHFASFDALTLGCFGSLAGSQEGSQIATDAAAVTGVCALFSLPESPN